MKEYRSIVLITSTGMFCLLRMIDNAAKIFLFNSSSYNDTPESKRSINTGNPVVSSTFENVSFNSKTVLSV